MKVLDGVKEALTVLGFFTLSMKSKDTEEQNDCVLLFLWREDFRMIAKQV